MSSKSDEYQTPRKYFEAARLVMGSIDLDIASSEENNKRILAKEFYSKENSMYNNPFYGNAWLNPSYSKPNLTKATARIINYYGAGLEQLIYLIPSYTSEDWYHKCLKFASAICLPDHRIIFLLNKKYQLSPRFANTFFYFGNDNAVKFCEVFRQFGFVDILPDR